MPHRTKHRTFIRSGSIYTLHMHTFSIYSVSMSHLAYGVRNNKKIQTDQGQVICVPYYVQATTWILHRNGKFYSIQSLRVFPMVGIYRINCFPQSATAHAFSHHLYFIFIRKYIYCIIYLVQNCIQLVGWILVPVHSS